jgi:hypothetical protein
MDRKMPPLCEVMPVTPPPRPAFPNHGSGASLTFHFLRLFIFSPDFQLLAVLVPKHTCQNKNHRASNADAVSLVPKPCWIFPWSDVNRKKSDVMTSFGLIDQSAVFCVIMRGGGHRNQARLINRMRKSAKSAGWPLRILEITAQL